MFAEDMEAAKVGERIDTIYLGGVLVQERHMHYIRFPRWYCVYAPDERSRSVRTRFRISEKSQLIYTNTYERRACSSNTRLAEWHWFRIHDQPSGWIVTMSSSQLYLTPYICIARTTYNFVYFLDNTFPICCWQHNRWHNWFMFFFLAIAHSCAKLCVHTI